jgi:hypothetical protein
MLRHSFLIFLLLAATTEAQTSVQLHITGELQSQKTARANFGRLPKQYRAADWTVSSNSPEAVKIPLARLIQAIGPIPATTVLSRTSSTSVVQDAQGNNPLNATLRVGNGIISGAVAAEALHAIPATGWGPKAVLGAEIGSLVLQFVFPTLQSHAVLSITAMMPDPVVLDPFGTVAGMVIVERAKGAAEVPLDVTVSVLIATLNK